MIPSSESFFWNVRRDGHTVENRIDGNTGQSSPLLEWNTQPLIRGHELRIYFIQTLGTIGFSSGGRIVTDALKIDRRIANVGPRGLRHGLPTTKRV